MVDITTLSTKHKLYEIVVSGRGIWTLVMIGFHTCGMFLYIPRLGVGCELDYSSDVSYITANIKQYFSAEDAAVFATGISHFLSYGIRPRSIKD